MRRLEQPRKVALCNGELARVAARKTNVFRVNTV